MRQAETARLLARELERLRAENRLREERLTSLVTDLSSRLQSLTAQLELEREQKAALEEKVDSLCRTLTGLPEFERRLSGLAKSLRKL